MKVKGWLGRGLEECGTSQVLHNAIVKYHYLDMELNINK